ncbi:MAG: IclR family transcriptional regulator [Acidobacteriota bacterium]|nr:IclR family transcriptional regulator [Acidobacteriota bacterium]
MIRARESKSAPIGVVTRVLKILEALHGAPRGLDLKGIAQATAINKSTAYRILAHLESEGYLFRESAGAYFIGPRLVRLASATNHHTVLREVSRPILHQLWRGTAETVNLAVPDGDEVLYVDVIESPHSFRLVSHPGMRRPMYCTALGKSIMAYFPAGQREKLLSSFPPQRYTPRTLCRPAQLRKELTKIRQRGFAVDDQEATLGARCVGAPVFGESGKVIAAVSISGPTTRIGKKQVPALGAKVTGAARAISARLVVK